MDSFSVIELALVMLLRENEWIELIVSSVRALASLDRMVTLNFLKSWPMKTYRMGFMQLLEAAMAVTRGKPISKTFSGTER